VALSIGRRLVPVSTLLVGFLLLVIVFGIALFALDRFVERVRLEATSLVTEATARVEMSNAGSGATGIANVMASRQFDSALLLVFVDSARRATVLRDVDKKGRLRTRIVVRSRTDRSAEPQATGALARLTLGVATIFGLQTVRSRADDLDIYASANETVFVADVRTYIPAFGLAIAAALLLTGAAARVLTREALQPLDQVTAALERFSAGDFTPEPVAAVGDRHLGALALAYNGAVAQVERSFAERARVNAAMRQFIADAGHQLRTPLTVIRGFIGILRQHGFAQDAETTHILQSMAQQSVLMSSLIEKLILLEQWEHRDGLTTALRVDVAELIADVVTPLALANPARDLQIDAVLGAYAVVDPDDFKHAISNVVDNALKYTDGPVRVVLAASPSEVHVTVSDRGPGLDRDQVARAFDRFYRGRRRDVEGSGLGLAIAKRAVERAGGRLRFESDVASGTTVTFSLPRVESKTTAGYPE
jgi:two-component system OmpR family sensor kinase